MMTRVNIHEAKTHLSKLLDQVEKGEEILIARAGKPVARLVAYMEPRAAGRRRLGCLEGKVQLTEDWDSPEINEEIAASFFEIEDETSPRHA